MNNTGLGLTPQLSKPLHVDEWNFYCYE